MALTPICANNDGAGIEGVAVACVYENVLRSGDRLIDNVERGGLRRREPGKVLYDGEHGLVFLYYI